MNKYIMLLVVALCVVLSLAAASPAPAPVGAAPKESLKGEEAVYLGYAGYPFVYPGAVAYVG